MPVNVVKRVGIRRVLRLNRLVNQREDALGGGQGALQLGKDVGRLVDRAGELARIQDKGGDAADGHLPGAEEQRAEHAHQRKRQVVDEIDQRADDAALVFALVIRLDGLLVDDVELLDARVLPAVGAQRRQAGELLLHHAVKLAELAAALPEQRFGHGRAPARRVDRERHRDAEHRQQLRRNGDHEPQRTDDGDDR